jgi:hypothetical protein
VIVAAGRQQGDPGEHEYLDPLHGSILQVGLLG